jgi:SAM-dependent methyltransferase
MRARTLVVAAAIGAAGALVWRAARTRGAPGPPAGDAAPVGWATCSAPSARAYELTFGLLLGGLYRRMAEDVASALAAIAEPTVLEVGPGPGHLAVELARRVPGLRLTGVDVDPAMVARATARAQREGLDDRLDFVVGDVAALPFADGSFDLVTSSFSVHHWPDAAAGFAEIRRALRPGGRAVLYDLPDAWGRLETQAPGLAASAVRGGFDEAAVAPLRWPGRVGLVRRLEVAAPERAR